MKFLLFLPLPHCLSPFPPSHTPFIFLLPLFFFTFEIIYQRRFLTKFLDTPLYNQRIIVVSFPEISGKVWEDSSFCYLNSLSDLEIFDYIQIDFLTSITGPEP